MPGRVASLEVERMWIPGKRKFDQRYYVLIPSLNPLIVLVRKGYLRFSAFEYQRDRVPGEDDELDRMRHVTNLAIQLYDAAQRTDSKHSAGDGPFTREGRDRGEGVASRDQKEGGADGGQVLQPVARLREMLIQSLGAGQGERAHERLETSARNAILQVSYPFLDRIRFLTPNTKASTRILTRVGTLTHTQVVYAIRHKLQPWDMEKKDVAQTWALVAMDVAYDTANNAYVLDLNARPAPTGTQHPSWYLDSRALIPKFCFCHPICLWRHCFLCHLTCFLCSSPLR
jgi:hypothetical protein